MSKYGAFSGLYFPVFGLNKEFNGVNLRIESEYRQIRTRKNSVFGHFSRSISAVELGCDCKIWVAAGKLGCRTFFLTDAFFRSCGYARKKLQFCWFYYWKKFHLRRKKHLLEEITWSYFVHYWILSTMGQSILLDTI